MDIMGDRMSEGELIFIDIDISGFKKHQEYRKDINSLELSKILINGVKLDMVKYKWLSFTGLDNYTIVDIILNMEDV